MPSSWTATLLDQEQIEHSSGIGSRLVDVTAMPDRTGKNVAQELGGRLLLRYLHEGQVSEFTKGSSDRGHWVTPTAIAPEEVVFWLALYAPLVRRKHALLIDPAQVETIRGPAWIPLGPGIEYYLPGGFEDRAVVDVGVIQVR